MGIESIENPFKVKISPITDVREIGSIASGQARSKSRKFDLKSKLRFTQNEPNLPPPDKEISSLTSDELTVKSKAQNNLKEAVKAFGDSCIDITS